MREISILTLSHAVLFPHGQLPIPLREKHECCVLGKFGATDQKIGVVYLRESAKMKWQTSKVPQAFMGCAGNIEMLERLPFGRVNMLLHGQKRFVIEEVVSVQPVLRAKVKYVDEQDFLLTEAEKIRLTRLLYQRISEYLKINLECDSLNLHWKFDNSRLPELINQAAMYLDIGLEEKQRILELSSLEKKYQFVSNFIEEKLAVARFSKNKMCILENPVLN